MWKASDKATNHTPIPHTNNTFLFTLCNEKFIVKGHRDQADHMDSEQNRNRGIDTWNRLTTVRGEGGTGWKKVKELAKEHICITHSYRKQCGDDGGGEKMGTCNSINNKIKFKIFQYIQQYKIINSFHLKQH